MFKKYFVHRLICFWFLPFNYGSQNRPLKKCIENMVNRELCRIYIEILCSGQNYKLIKTSMCGIKGHWELHYGKIRHGRKMYAISNFLICKVLLYCDNWKFWDNIMSNLETFCLKLFGYCAGQKVPNVIIP